MLPPRVMAGHPATLAVFGVDGKLAAGVTVTIDDGQTVTTDRTGRATFIAPAAHDYMLAKASGASAAALVDPATGASEPAATTVPPLISLRRSLLDLLGGTARRCRRGQRVDQRSTGAGAGSVSRMSGGDSKLEGRAGARDVRESMRPALRPRRNQRSWICRSMPRSRRRCREKNRGWRCAFAGPTKSSGSWSTI